MRRILGIDPGSKITGFGIIEQPRFGPARYLVSGSILPKATSFNEKLVVLHGHLREVIKEYTPQEAAIERIFMGKNAASALTLGEARGVLRLALAQEALPTYEYASKLVKQSVTGHGQSSKEGVAQMVRRLLQLSLTLGSDASDALAVALTHAHMSLTQAKLRVTQR